MKVNRGAATLVKGEGGTKLSDALRAASVKAGEEHQKSVREKLITYYTELYGTAAAYDNVVILAGYAAFFTLWVGVSDDISHLCRLVTVALMGPSLMLYITWHILQMLTRQTLEFKRAQLFEIADDPERFNAGWAAADREYSFASARIIRLWPWIFIPQVVLGYAGGMVLSYNAIAIILDWPQLTG